jgi:hypothetical protein
MIIGDDEFKAIVEYCEHLMQNMASADTAECLRLGVSVDAVTSIYMQMYTRRVKKLSNLIEHDVANISQVYFTFFTLFIVMCCQRVANGEKLFDIAKEKRFSPYKLAKIYTKYKYQRDFKLSQVMSDLSLTQFENSAIAADILRCCLEDPCSSQSADAVKHCMGQEFEELLYGALKERNICFETEAELRLQGKPKTPDALLLFPMGVKIGSEDDWEIIHWIDSKGTYFYCAPISCGMVLMLVIVLDGIVDSL